MKPTALPAFLPTPCFVVGDAHLGVASGEAEGALLKWFGGHARQAKSVVIMGDLFDFWFAWKYAMPRRGFRVLAAIANLVESEIPVVWLGGNHDCWHGDALEAETGARYTLDPWHGAIGKWRAELSHGDGLREKADAPYRRLRSLLRNRIAIRAFGMLHPTLATQLASSSSKGSRHSRAVDEGRELLQEATKRLSAPNGPDLIMHGHTHQPRLERAGYGVYANAGAWYVDQQYVRIDDASISSIAYSNSGESHVLHTINRVAEESPAKGQEVIGGV
ncbi:MAG: UDP-2,3-diacylglucosamine diphosphatase [Gemmatimonadota bacterium]|nr:UDP-2,3-diacylglucosamine diphosphatase [Gemmatimonadota bacterium]